MKQLFAFALLSLLSVSAFAYKDGTYTCKSIDGTPDNVYKIQSISLTPQGASLPYMEVTSYYRENFRDPNSRIVETHLKGFATVASNDAGVEMLLLGSFSFEFKNDQLLRCKQPASALP